MTKAPPWSAPPLEPTEEERPVRRVEPTEEERRNGWTTETLSQYLHGREVAQNDTLNPHHASRRKGPPQAAGGPRFNFPAGRAWQNKNP